MALFSQNAEQVLKDRYLLKDKNGQCVETIDQLFKRVAKHISKAETTDKAFWENEFYQALNRLDFLPNSPTLMNSGLKNGQLSACFVLPIHDSLKSIFTTLKNAALIHQSGGGTGFNFSNLRPKDDWVSSSSGTSSGPVSFIKIFDAATEYIKQGGKRRGANMGILNCDHPDIEEFVCSKSDPTQLNNFNLSVGITDTFMEAVVNKSSFALINPRTSEVKRQIKAVDLWNLIVENAWRTGDPGLVFLDTINKHNPTPNLSRIDCTNPCGEVPLLDYESCNLGSINLSHMTKTNKDVVLIDWDKLARTIEIGIRFLDNVITVNHYLLKPTRNITLKNRKIGLGVMGWADLLILLGIPYASKDAIQLAEKLMKFIQEQSLQVSNQLSIEKGSFPEWNNSIYADTLQLRNATCNSIAPTGSISIIADTSYSIEPLYALAFQRIGILEDQTQTEINSLLIEKLKKIGKWDDAIKQTISQTGSIQGVEGLEKAFKDCFKVSTEIPWHYHLKHQRAFQNYTDNAVSKTINLPKNASQKDISNIYMTAWNYGLKGITIYRDKSRDKQVLNKCDFNFTGAC